MGTIYLDHAAATPLDPAVAQTMLPFAHNDDEYNEYGNPSSIHAAGRHARESVEAARATVARLLGVLPEEIIFTGSGTESINLAIKGVARAYASKGKHIITTMAEHEAVLNTCRYLESEGFKITYLPVDKNGLVTADQLNKAITQHTILISIIYANNEIGSVNNVKELAQVTRNKGVLFHTDACQAAGILDVKNLGVDLLSINGSKMYGPKGTGLLYVKEGVRIVPLLHGGGQEHGLRSGTENVAGIVGFAKAFEIADAAREVEAERLAGLRNKLIEGILSSIPHSMLNGHSIQRLPNNVNISILGVEGEAIVERLSEQGVYCSTGSACTSRNIEPSHVLKAIGLSYEEAAGTVRFSLGRRTTEADITIVVENLKNIVENMRAVKKAKRMLITENKTVG